MTRVITTFEKYPFTRRRRWSKERQLADRERRAKLRAHFIRYCPNPLAPEDTVWLVHEELQVIERLRAERKVWVKMWPLLNELAGAGHEADKRPRRQAFLALLTRMIREKKLVRHRPTSEIALAEWLREPVKL